MRQLRLEDIDWNEGVVHIRRAKTYRERTLPPPSDVGTVLSEYIQQDHREREFPPHHTQVTVRYRPVSFLLCARAERLMWSGRRARELPPSVYPAVRARSRKARNRILLSLGSQRSRGQESRQAHQTELPRSVAVNLQKVPPQQVRCSTCRFHLTSTSL